MTLASLTGIAAFLAPLLFVVGTFLWRRSRRKPAPPQSHSDVRRGRGYDLGTFIQNGGLGSPGKGGAGERVVIPGEHDER